MEEKVIIKSKLANVTLASGILAGIGLVLFLVVFFAVYPIGGSYDISMLISRVAPLYLAFTFLPCVIIAIIFYVSASKIELTVSDKRVYGSAAFGKRVDLPLDAISAVGTSAFNGIAITTASGAIKFVMIKNRDEIHSAVSKLLVERQSKEKPVATTTIKQEIPQSNADELKKYKELLDSGVISQEEFDAKKKQLLGL